MSHHYSPQAIDPLLPLASIIASFIIPPPPAFHFFSFGAPAQHDSIIPGAYKLVGKFTCNTGFVYQAEMHVRFNLNQTVNGLVIYKSREGIHECQIEGKYSGNVIEYDENYSNMNFHYRCELVGTLLTGNFECHEFGMPIPPTVSGKLN